MADKKRTFQINITGAGTMDEIVDSLYRIADNIQKQEGEPAEWVDDALTLTYSEITKLQ